MKGLQISPPNAFGFVVARVHYTMDPEKDPGHPDPEIAARGQAWIEHQRPIYPDPGDWDREMELNFFSGKGRRVFPQFSAAIHNRALVALRHKVVYRSWDFGWHSPATLFAQIDGQGRLCILKELVLAQQTTQDQCPIVIAKSAEWWSQHAAGFEDFCDPAGQQIKSIASEKSERRDLDVLNGFGIYPSYEWGWNRKDSRALIHRLLGLRSDGTPSLYVDEIGCPLLSQAFLGRYVYKEKLDGRTEDEPDDKSHPWADLMAALRYLVMGLRERLGLLRMGYRPIPIQSVRPAPAFHGYGTPLSRVG